MKRLRLKTEEWEEMLKDISAKFHEDCKMSLSNFEYTKKDVEDFVKTLPKKEVIKPTIEINIDAYTRMYELVKQSPIELQWHMLVDRDLESNTYIVEDIMLFPQTNSGSSTTTDQNEFAKWQEKLILDIEFPIEKLRGHGHSHVNMGVFSSSVDNAYQRDIITKVDNDDYYIFLILNKKMEMYALVYDFHQQVVFDNNEVTIKIIDNDMEDIKEWCKEQIKKYCKNENKPHKTSYTPKPVEPEFEYVIDSARRAFGKRR